MRRSLFQIQLRGTTAGIFWAIVFVVLLWAAWHGELRVGSRKGQKLPAIKEVFQERDFWPYSEQDTIPNR